MKHVSIHQLDRFHKISQFHERIAPVLGNLYSLRARRQMFGPNTHLFQHENKMFWTRFLQHNLMLNHYVGGDNSLTLGKMDGWKMHFPLFPVSSYHLFRKRIQATSGSDVFLNLLIINSFPRNSLGFQDHRKPCWRWDLQNQSFKGPPVWKMRDLRRKPVKNTGLSQQTERSEATWLKHEDTITDLLWLINQPSPNVPHPRNKGWIREANG